MRSYHLVIKGKVQGVFFRATAKDVAQQLSLTGWVKNTEAGDVEAIIQGSENSLQQFISWSKQGPKAAFVSGVEVTEVPVQQFEKFEIKRGL
jgi:acylphosphatase